MCKRAAALATTRQALKKRRAEAASSARAASMARVRMCALRRVDRWEAVAPAVRAALKQDGWAVLAFAGPQIKASGHAHVSRARLEVDRVSADIIELSKRDDMFGLFQSLKRTRRGAAVVPDGGDGKRKYVRCQTRSPVCSPACSKTPMTRAMMCACELPSSCCRSISAWWKRVVRCSLGCA